MGCIENLPETVPIYGPDSCMFVKNDEQHAVRVMMKGTAKSWIRLEKDRSMERRERDRTTSGESTSSQHDPQTHS